MRRTAVGFLSVALLAFASAVAAEPYLWAPHYSEADIVDGRAVYDVAEFAHVSMGVDDDDVTATEEHAKAKGTLTLVGGNYTFWNGTEEEEVAGTVKTFGLIPDGIEVGEKGLYYVPANGQGEDIVFQGAADTGLKGKEVRWEFPSLPALNGKARVPAFRSTAEQLTSYVPYVELVRSGSDITGVKWRLVDPKAPDKALPLAFDARVRIRVYDPDKRVYGSVWHRFEANVVPEGTETLEASLPEAGLRYIQVALIASEGGEECHYRWTFSPRKQSDEGVADWGELKPQANPFKLKAGETRVVKLLLKEGFSASFGRKSIAVKDESLLSARGYGTETLEGKDWDRFELKGLKPGKTSVTIVYVDHTGKRHVRYNTLPIEVWVTDENGNVPQPEGKSSGGGCSAGLWGLSLLALLPLPLRRRR